MTPEERQLITGLFDRMRNLGTLDKDRDAEALIGERVRSTPDAAYMLVQSVLVQEQALQKAESRIRELEDGDHVNAPASGGSFLGGLFGGGRPASEATGTSVPRIGSRPASLPPPGAGERQASGPLAASAQQPGAGGGFMRQAMATAAGVAGGVLAAGAIRDLLGGGSANASADSSGKEGAPGGADATSQQAGNADAGNKAQPASDEHAGKDAQRDDNYEDASDDSSGWDDGGDFEI